MIFQDPGASLDPRMTIGALRAEPMIVHGLERDRAARRKRCAELLQAVGLSPDSPDRRPSQFSGGQQQRICIARALVVDPEVLVCDEPVSALDVSLQAQVLNLLDELQAERVLSYVFISHDVSLVRYFSQRPGDRDVPGYRGGDRPRGADPGRPAAPVHAQPDRLRAEPGAATVERPRAERTPALTGDLPEPAGPAQRSAASTPRCPIG